MFEEVEKVLTEGEKTLLDEISFRGQVYDAVIQMGSQAEYIQNIFEDSSVDDDVYNQFADLVVEFQKQVLQLILKGRG